MELPRDLFIFNQENREFLTGKRVAPYLGKESVVFGVSVIFFFTGVIISLIFIMMISAIANLSFFTSLLIVLPLFLLLVTLIISGLYKSDKEWRQRVKTEGIIIFAKVLKYDFVRPVNFVDPREKLWLLYQLTTPNGENLEKWSFLNADRRAVRAGLELPKIGQSIAVLYVDNRNTIVL